MKITVKSGLRNECEAIFAVMNTTQAVVKIRPEKNTGLYGIWTPDLCDSGACSALPTESTIMLVRNKPVKWWINDC